MKKLSLIVAGVAALAAASAAQAGTLEDVRAKGFIQCGVSQGLPGSLMLMIVANGPAWMSKCVKQWQLQYSVIKMP